MNLSKPYAVLMKHLDKPQCFLEDKLFRECVENFQNLNLISARLEQRKEGAVKQLKISVLKENVFSPVNEPLPSQRWS